MPTNDLTIGTDGRLFINVGGQARNDGSFDILVNGVAVATVPAPLAFPTITGEGSVSVLGDSTTGYVISGINTDTFVSLNQQPDGSITSTRADGTPGPTIPAPEEFPVLQGAGSVTITGDGASGYTITGNDSNTFVTLTQNPDGSIASTNADGTPGPTIAATAAFPDLTGAGSVTISGDATSGFTVAGADTNTFVTFSVNSDGSVSTTNADGTPGPDLAPSVAITVVFRDGDVWMASDGTSIIVDADDVSTWPQDFEPTPIAYVLNASGEAQGVVVFNAVDGSYNTIPFPHSGGLPPSVPDVIASGSIADLDIIEGQARADLDVTGDFQNADGYELAPSSASLPAGVTFVNGVFSFDESLTAASPSATIVVRGTSSAGGASADSSFDMTIQSVPDAVSLNGFALTIDTPLFEGYSSVPTSETGGPVRDQNNAVIAGAMQYSTDGTSWSGTLPTVARGNALHVSALFTAGTASERVVAGNSPITVQAAVVPGGTLVTEYAAQIGTRAVPTGSRWATAYKDPAVDPLPAGVSVSGINLTISGDDTLFEGWDIEGYVVILSGSGIEVRDCQNLNAGVSPTGNSAPNIRVTPTADNAHIHHNTIVGIGYGQTNAFVDQQTTGTGAADTCALNLLVEYNDVSGLPNDYFKTAGNGSIVRFNRLGKPENYPAGTVAWDANATYSAGDYVLYPLGFNNLFSLKRSLVSNNTGNEPAQDARLNTAEWEGLDPHVDLITCFASIGAGSGFIGNWLDNNTGSNAVGVTNWFRPSLNSNALTLEMNDIYCIGNVMPDGTFAGFNPIDPSRSVAHTGPIHMRHNVINPGITGSHGVNGFPQDLRWDSNVRPDGTPVPASVLAGTTAETTPEPAYNAITVPRAVGGTTPPVVSGPRVSGIEGQSQVERIINSGAFNRALTPPPLAAENLTLYRSDPTINGGAAFKTTVTDTTIAAGEVNPAMVVLSNFLEHNDPGGEHIVADFFREGRDFRSAIDDSNTNRSFQPFIDVVDLLATDGMTVGVLHWWHYGSTAASIKSFEAEYSPALTGQNADGTPFTLGDTNNGPVRTYRVDNILWDFEAPSDQLGRGLFTRDDTKLFFVGINSYDNSVPSTDPEYRNFSTPDSGGNFAGFDTQLDRGAWQAVTAFADSPRIAEISVGYTEGAHLTTYTDGLHPDETDANGVYQEAITFGLAHLKAHGILNLQEPKIVQIAPSTTDARVFQALVSLPNGGILTTKAERLNIPNDPAMPHMQDVMGFEIRRAGEADNERRPVFSDASYPSNRRGAVTIIDSGSGTGANRFGVVEFTMVNPVLEASQLDYGRGARSAMLRRNRDEAAKLRMLVEYIPAIDPGGIGACHGIPVAQMDAPLAITGVATTSTPASAPDAFAVSDWSLATSTADNALTVNLLALPANNGSPITAIEYTLNSGATWLDSGRTTAGAFEIAPLPASTQTVRLLAVNGEGDGPVSDAKTATVSGSTSAAPTATYLGGVQLEDFTPSAPKTFAVPGASTGSRLIVAVMTVNNIVASSVTRENGGSPIAAVKLGETVAHRGRVMAYYEVAAGSGDLTVDIGNSNDCIVHVVETDAVPEFVDLGGSTSATDLDFSTAGTAGQLFLGLGFSRLSGVIWTGATPTTTNGSVVGGFATYAATQSLGAGNNAITLGTFGTFEYQSGSILKF